MEPAAMTADQQDRLTRDALSLLGDIRDTLEGFIDVEDGNDGPRPNWAMSLSMEIDELLRRAGR